MSKKSKNPSLWFIAFHVFMTVVTMGNWLWILAIWYIAKYFKNK